MNKVLFDTNIWIDVILDRPSFCENSKAALMACIESDIQMIIAATSLKDVFYFAVKSAGHRSGYRAVELIMEIAHLAQVDAVVCEHARELELPDFEDGIVAACAVLEQVDAIVTRDERAFRECGIARYTPAELCNKLGYESIDI